MATVIDYVHESTDTFDERPVCRLDGLVFSWLANMRLPENVADSTGERGLTLAQIAKLPNVSSLTMPMHDSAGTLELLSACARSERFKGIRCCRAVSEWSESVQRQFAAVTFLLPQGAYLAFRGTDDTIVGWKENFNMSFRSFVPAQEDAREYLERACAYLDGRIWLGGHSKGGNLAVYATMMVDAAVRERITRCFSHDGPGFIGETTSEPGWAAAYDLVDKTVPEGSIIGLLLESPEVTPIIVESTNKSLMQHAPFSWVVDGNDFGSGGAVSYDSYRRNKRLSSWVLGMTAEQRERFIEVLYKLAQATGEVTFSGLVGSVRDGSLSLVLRRLDGMDESDRSFFVSALDELVATMLLGPAPKEAKTNAEAVDIAGDRIDDITAKFNDTMDKWSKYFG